MTTKPYDFPFVEIYWLDADVEGGWNSAADEDDPYLTPAEGRLLKIDNHFLHLGLGSFNHDTGEFTSQHRIPLVCIHQMRTIRRKMPDRKRVSKCPKKN